MSFALGSLIGGAAQGFSDQQQKAILQALQQQQNVGSGIAGSALFGGAPQTPQNPLQALLAKFGVGGQPQQPQAPMQLPSAGGGGAPQPGPMGGGLMPTVGGAPGAPQPPAQGGAPMPQQQPQAPAPQPQGAFSGGTLTLDQAVQRINQVKPNATPQEKMAALSQILPIMNAQSQAQYRQIMTQLAPARLAAQQENVDERTRHDKTTEKQGAARVNQGQERIDNQRQEFNTRLAERVREYDTTLEQNYTKLQATNDRAEATRLAIEYRAAAAAKLAAARDEIQASNSLDPDEKPKLVAQAVADNKVAIARLDAATAALKARSAGDVRVSPNADGTKRTERAPPSTRAPAETAPAQDTSTVIQQAKDAIAQGAPRDKVLQKLKEMGVAAPGL